MKKIIISLLTLTLFGFSNASEQTGELKSTATMNATCSIEADSINFGVVASPLMAQTANSDMTVKCNNSLPYTINLAYGGIYGSGGGEKGNFTYTIVGNTNYSQSIKIYNNSVAISKGNQDIFCSSSSSSYIKFYTTEAASFYGNPSAKLDTFVSDTKGLCGGSYIKKNVFDTLGQPTPYSYGMITGMSRGDQIAYSIAVPGDSNKVWNTGNNSYKATGTGENQVVAMIAKIVPDKSRVKYPAPDMYLDTVTAIISY